MKNLMIALVCGALLLTTTARAGGDDSHYYRLESPVIVEGQSFNALLFKSTELVIFGRIDASGKWTPSKVRRLFSVFYKEGHFPFDPGARTQLVWKINGEDGISREWDTEESRPGMDFDGETLKIFPEKKVVKAERMGPTQNLRVVFKAIDPLDSSRRKLKVMLLDQPIRFDGGYYNTFHFERFDPRYSGILTAYDFKVRLSETDTGLSGKPGVLEPTLNQTVGMEYGFPLPNAIRVKGVAGEPDLVFDEFGVTLADGTRVKGTNYDYRKELIPGRSYDDVILRPICEVIFEQGF